MKALPLRSSGLAAGLLLLGFGAASADHLFVVASDGTVGNCAVIELEPPYAMTAGLEPVGAVPRVRHFLGRHWVVNGAPDDEIQVIDPVTFDTALRFPVGPDPVDVAVVDETLAYVSRYDSPWILAVNAGTGAPIDSVDLSAFSDPDGLPECAWMELVGTKLFVQLQRVDRNVSGTSTPPAMLAVVDVTTNTLIDADPVEPGVQAIALVGPLPSYRMQHHPATNLLTVSTPGLLLDGLGGIEEIDVATLENHGFLLDEMTFSVAIGPHWIVAPDRGFLIGHTDFATSSHLDAFALPGGTFLAEYHVTFDWVETIVHDPERDLMAFPDPVDGVHLFRASNGDTLSGALPVGLPPRDLVLVPDPPAVPIADPVARRDAPLRVFPNPTDATSHVHFTASRPGPVAGTLHDVGGRLVRTLRANPLVAGPAVLSWDGRDEDGRPVAAGVYVLNVSGAARNGSVRIHRVR
jgi:hypothetical protein